MLMDDRWDAGKAKMKVREPTVLDISLNRVIQADSVCQRQFQIGKFSRESRQSRTLSDYFEIAIPMSTFDAIGSEILLVDREYFLESFGQVVRILNVFVHRH